jgi:hypothetical protein
MRKFLPVILLKISIVTLMAVVFPKLITLPFLLMVFVYQKKLMEFLLKEENPDQDGFLSLNILNRNYHLFLLIF